MKRIDHVFDRSIGKSDPRMKIVLVHGLNSNFNSIFEVLKTGRHFQYKSNPHISLNPSFWFFVLQVDFWNFFNSLNSLRLLSRASRYSKFCCNNSSNSCFLISTWHSARICSFCLHRAPICAFPTFASWPHGLTSRPVRSPTDVSARSDTDDDDWPTDKPSRWEWETCIGVHHEAFARARCHRTPHPRGTLAWRTVGGSGTLQRTRHKSPWGRSSWAPNLRGGRSRHGTPSPFRRSTKCCCCPQSCGRSARRSGRDWRWLRRWGSRNNGGLKVEEIRSYCNDHEMTRTSETWATMWCAIMTTRTWILDYAHMGSRVHHSRVEVHVRCMEGALGLGVPVVIGVVLDFTTQTQYNWWSRCHWCRARFHHAHAIPSAEFFPCGFCSPLIFLHSDCILWSSISSVAKMWHTCIEKTGHLKRCLYTSRRLQQTDVSCTQSNCNQTNWIRENHFRRFLPNTARIGSLRSLNTWCISVLTFGVKNGEPPGTLPYTP